jgi:hypothetical protein
LAIVMTPVPSNLTRTGSLFFGALIGPVRLFDLSSIILAPARSMVAFEVLLDPRGRCHRFANLLDQPGPCGTDCFA